MENFVSVLVKFCLLNGNTFMQLFSYFDFLIKRQQYNLFSFDSRKIRAFKLRHPN